MRSKDQESLPEYDAQLAAYHRAFAPELEAIVAELPLPPDARVLDLACGDGTYAFMFARRLGTGGLVVGVDSAPQYLALADARRARNPLLARSAFVAGSFDQLSFPPGTFDLAWCAQSLYSLPDPVAALGRMREAVRPGGLVAVLENDSLHDLLLPWPVELEIAVRAAEYETYRTATGRQAKFYVSRNLCALCRAAGLEPLRLRTHAFDRQAPLGDAEREFVAQYLGRLMERIRPHLPTDVMERVRPMLDPRLPTALLHDPSFTLTSLNAVLWGRRPA